MKLAINQKVRVVPINTGKKSPEKRKEKVARIISITKYNLTLMYRTKAKESFSLAEIICPESFKLLAWNSSAWKQVTVPSGAMTLKEVGCE